MIKKANSTELDILRELIKNIAKKNIEVSKSILNTKKKFAGIVSLISSYMRMSTIHRSQKSLRKFLLKFSTVLPIAAKTEMSQEGLIDYSIIPFSRVQNYESKIEEQSSTIADLSKKVNHLESLQRDDTVIGSHSEA